MTTEKTIRGNGKWVKITRNNTRKYFTICMGWAGKLSSESYNTRTYSFNVLPTWEYALDMATKMLND